MAGATAIVVVLLTIAAAAPATGYVRAGNSAPIVVIDPGHDRFPNPDTEPIGPGSVERKIKDGGGARGAVTGTAEAELTLDVSKRASPLLRRAGVRVRLTRTRTESISQGNIERAAVANRLRARLFVRVHADGAERREARGTHTLHPAYRAGWTDDIYVDSRRAASLLQQELVRALGFPDHGPDERADITGFNWADVPAVLTELGFLTNPTEDRLLATSAYRRRAALGLCRGTLRFLNLPPGRCGGSRAEATRGSESA